MLGRPATRSLPGRYRLASPRVLDFLILGPLEVVDGDRFVRLGGPKQRATLAILLLSANRVVSVERLADDLYTGAPPVTAVTQVQRQVSELRKLLGASVIETRSPGYLIHVEQGRLDLDRFERSTHEAGHALEQGDPARASGLLQEALALWRGAPLADLTYESFAQTAIARLDELRLNAIEQRVEADLELGRHGELLAELESLVWDHPLRERLRGQLMLALYRSGRQAEALDVYRKTRDALVTEFGIEPSKRLQDLERRILRQDSALAPPPQASRTLLVVGSTPAQLEDLLGIAEPLAREDDRELILSQLVHEAAAVGSAARSVNERCEALDMTARGAAFTALEPERDVVRLAETYDVELVLVGDGVIPDLDAVVVRSPADVAVLFPSALESTNTQGVFVPFGGGDNDWAALELGAWLASSSAVRLTLVGTASDPSRGRRDASRLLADASLAIQRVVGVAAEPLLVDLAEDALLAAVEPATVVIAGFPSRRTTELGSFRRTLVDGRRAPVLLVHRGTRPSGLAPRDSWTRFSWSIQS